MNSPSSEQKPLLAPEHETEILSRVEENLVISFRKMNQAPAPSFASSLQTWLQWGLGSVAVAAAVLLLLVQPWQQTSPLLLQGGVSVAQGHNTSQHIVPVETQPNKTGSIEESKRWKVTLAQQTRLALVKTSKRERTVRLQRGFVKIHVRKGSMKQFLVESDDVQVVVTGTVFSVEREKKWVRVELFRGSVTVNHKGHRQHKLEPGQGVRIDLSSGRSQGYRFSVKPKPRHVAKKVDGRLAQVSPMDRLRSLYEQKRLREMHRYALDLAVSRQHTKQDRKRWLKWVVEREFKLGGRSYAVQTLLALAALGGEGSASEFGEAVATCRKVFQVDTTKCIRLTRRYLKQYPNNPVLQGVSCNLAEDLLKLWSHEKNSKVLSEARELFHKHRCQEVLCIDSKCPPSLQTLLKKDE